MRRTLITVIFAGFIGSVPAQPKVDLGDFEKSVATRPTRQLEAKPVKVNISTTNEKQQLRSETKNGMDKASNTDETGEQSEGSGTLLAIFILMGAIALRRQSFRKH